MLWPRGSGILTRVPPDNVEIVKGIFRAWEVGDFSSVDWADPEIEFSIPGPDPKVHRGVEAAGSAWAEWLRAWSEFSIRAESYQPIDGDKVVVEQVFRGKGRGSGIPVDETHGGAVFTLRDGKVTRFQGFTSLEAAIAEAEGAD
jgi:ketosteroid isomerase-like protein